MDLSKTSFNRRILIMIIVAGTALPIQMIISSAFDDSEFHLALGVAMAVFGIILAIQITLYGKVKKEIS